MITFCGEPNSDKIKPLSLDDLNYYIKEALKKRFTILVDGKDPGVISICNARFIDVVKWMNEGRIEIEK